MSNKRKPIPKATETKVLLACRRRCCLCWHLLRDDAEQPGQIAHIGDDPSNNSEDNLAWLCLTHHEQYDRTSRQAKGITEDELRHARAELVEHLHQPIQADGQAPSANRPAKASLPSASRPPVPAAAAPLFPAGTPDRLYVVFCRIVGLKSLPADHLAAAQQVLMDVAEQARQTPGLQVTGVRSSVYGRFLCVRNPVPALRAAEQVLDQAARSGVHLAIGLTVGRLEEVDDLGQKNLIGPPINLAARLAAMPEADDQIVLTPEVHKAACNSSSQFPKDSFTGPHDGTVKRTEFKYHVRRHPTLSYGLLPLDGDYPPSFDAHAVVFDIARFSEKGVDDQWKAVTALRRLVLGAMSGGQARADQKQLWHAPAGDGGVLVFSTESGGGDAALRFAWTLSRHCRDEVEIRLGLATGPAVVLAGQLPVGPGIMLADKLCGYPPTGGFCANHDFLEALSPAERKQWTATPVPGDPEALLLEPASPPPRKSGDTANPQVGPSVSSGAPLVGHITSASEAQFADAAKCQQKLLDSPPEFLFGREKELADLDQAWANPKTRVLTIWAWGGSGKSALVAKWAITRDVKNNPEFGSPFYWTFPTDTPSADIFIAAALAHFGGQEGRELACGPASPEHKGAKLAEFVARQRNLLVLDGLEPLQSPPSSPHPGHLRDGAIKALLRGLAQKNPGLCIVTTRYKVTDLASFRDETAPEWELQILSVEAGIKLLKKLKLEGPEDEFRKLVEDVQGHALTLDLLGRYLAKVHKHDIRRRSLVKFDKADATIEGGRAFKVMAAYEKWLEADGENGVRALAALRLLGLFDRPADAGCLLALRREPAITGLTEPLVGLCEEDWNSAISSLADCHLVAVSRNLESVDAHALIREYLAKQLREKNPDAWREGHRRLYEHLCASTPDKPQPTLEDLQPLYQAVAHGCQAGMGQEACELYRDRIVRREEFYSTKVRGLFGPDLGAVACFFANSWTCPTDTLAEEAQAWLLLMAGIRLQVLGRLNEADDALQTVLARDKRRERWKEAALIGTSLCDLNLAMGRVNDAVGHAEEAIRCAEQSGSPFARFACRQALANAYLQAGDAERPQKEFATSERELPELQDEKATTWVRFVESQRGVRFLPSKSGYQYCDALLSKVERKCWSVWLAGRGGSALDSPGGMKESGLRETLQAVRVRAKTTLGWSELQGRVFGASLDHLTLGRCALYEGFLDWNGGPQTPILVSHALQTARPELDAAVGGLRRGSQLDHLPAGLLSRAWLRSLMGTCTGPKSAHADLDEAWEIVARIPMRLFMADIHLYRARLFFREQSYPWTSPKADLAAARKLIEQCGYWRRKEELEDAEKAIGV